MSVGGVAARSAAPSSRGRPASRRAVSDDLHPAAPASPPRSTQQAVAEPHQLLALPRSTLAHAGRLRPASGGEPAMGARPTELAAVRPFSIDVLNRSLRPAAQPREPMTLDTG